MGVAEWVTHSPHCAWLLERLITKLASWKLQYVFVIRVVEFMKWRSKRMSPGENIFLFVPNLIGKNYYVLGRETSRVGTKWSKCVSPFPRVCPDSSRDHLFLLHAL